MSRLLTTIRQKRGITVEELAEFCALEYSRAVELCTCLELDGFINIDLLQRCSISPKV
jgi:DNA-binding MarR family transcriptional regulator